MTLFDELKRRRGFRVAAMYAVGAWAVIQIVTTIFPQLLKRNDRVAAMRMIHEAASTAGALDLAKPYIVIGEPDSALKHVKRAADQWAPSLAALMLRPDVRRYASHPLYQQIFAEMHLPNK